MKVIVTRRCMVQPIKPAFNGRMPLTEFDQIGVLTHVPTIYFYRPSPKWLNSNHTIFTTLQTSLAQVLVHFYPLAGRLRWLHGARLELDCNNAGAQLIEAESDATLDDLGDFSPSPDFRYLVPEIDYSSPVEEIPLLSIQITKFKCGGITLGFSISHAIVDGQSALHFFSEWARLARGEPIGSPPFLDRRLLRAGEPPSEAPSLFEHPQFDPPPVLLGRSNCKEEREKPTTEAMLQLSKAQVETLKNAANRGRVSDTRAYTRYEVVAGHIWRCACMARVIAAEQPTALAICVDVRGRMKPRLPENFFGNAILDVNAQAHSGELTGRALGFAAGRIRKAVEGVTDEYVNSAIDLLKKVEDLSRYQDIQALRTKEGPVYGNPNMVVVSWMWLPLDGLDFGWGKEIFVGPGTHDCDGDSLILPAYDGNGGLSVALCLEAARMDDIKKYFYREMGT